MCQRICQNSKKKKYGEYVEKLERFRKVLQRRHTKKIKSMIKHTHIRSDI